MVILPYSSGSKSKKLHMVSSAMCVQKMASVPPSNQTKKQRWCRQSNYKRHSSGRGVVKKHAQLQRCFCFKAEVTRTTKTHLEQQQQPLQTFHDENSSTPSFLQVSRQFLHFVVSKLKQVSQYGIFKSAYTDHRFLQYASLGSLLAQAGWGWKCTAWLPSLSHCCTW